jgi:integrase
MGLPDQDGLTDWADTEAEDYDDLDARDWAAHTAAGGEEDYTDDQDPAEDAGPDLPPAAADHEPLHDDLSEPSDKSRNSREAAKYRTHLRETRAERDAMAVGLRQSEALALPWADVDLEQGTLTVRRGVHRIRGQGLVYEEPRADRSRRTAALPAPLVEALRAHRAAQVEERLAAGAEWANLNLIFAQPNGKAIERKSDWRA